MTLRVQISPCQARRTSLGQAVPYLARRGDIWPDLFGTNLLMLAGASGTLNCIAVRELLDLYITTVEAGLRFDSRQSQSTLLFLPYLRRKVD